MPPPIACWYYARYLPPYVEGTLQALHPVHCRRLQGHIARCGRCRESMRALSETHRQLHSAARAEDVWSVPERSPWRRRPSLADRVSTQLLLLEDRARRRRQLLGLQIACLVVAFAVLLLLVQPTPARDWIDRNLLGITPALPAKVIGSSGSASRSSPRPRIIIFDPRANVEARNDALSQDSLDLAPMPTADEQAPTGKSPKNAVHKKSRTREDQQSSRQAGR